MCEAVCSENKICKGFIDLHLHLDGSISVQSARELSRIEGIPLPESDEALERALTVSGGCRDLNEYLSKFSLPCSLMQSREALEKATYNLCKELSDMGCLYAEIRFAPQKHLEKGLTQEEAICAALEGLRKSGFFAQLILCCMRDGRDNTKENLETVALTKKYYQKGVCACDLAGAEALFPNERYAYIFEAAAREGVPFTIHAGEALGAESVAAALDFGARRIGHGVRAYEDRKVVKRLQKEGVPLEICPTSNLHTAVFPSLSEMPIPRLEREGVIVTINSDNMRVSNTNAARELRLVQKAFGYGKADIERLLTNSVRAAFLDPDQKEALLAAVLKSF